MGFNSDYSLKQAGCDPFVLTENEYKEFVELLKAKRAVKVREEILSLVLVIGKANAKNAVREILKEIED